MNSLPISFIMSFILIIPVIIIFALVLASREENNNMNKHNAKYAFYYLLSFVALVFIALSVGMVFFEIINKLVYDAIDNTGFSSGVLQFAISALIIATPIYYIISNLIAKGLRKQELEKDSGIRRWLTYFIVLASSLIILGVLIAAITNFLNGELTTRFILKSLVAVIIAAATFSYYFYDIKREDLITKDKVVKIFFFASLALVLASFILAWFFVDSPKVMRDRRLDQVVLNNIGNIENSVNSYYEKNKKLPDSLEVLKNNSDFYLNEKMLKDPESGAAIDYNKKSATEFELCATFRTNSKELNDQNGAYYSISSSQIHLAGYQCLKGNLYALNNVPVKGIDINQPAATVPVNQVKPSFPTPPNAGNDVYIN